MREYHSCGHLWVVTWISYEKEPCLQRSSRPPTTRGSNTPTCTLSPSTIKDYEIEEGVWRSTSITGTTGVMFVTCGVIHRRGVNIHNPKSPYTQHPKTSLTLLWTIKSIKPSLRFDNKTVRMSTAVTENWIMSLHSNILTQVSRRTGPDQRRPREDYDFNYSLWQVVIHLLLQQNWSTPKSTTLWSGSGGSILAFGNETWDMNSDVCQPKA